MKVTGSAAVHAQVPKVWDALLDPAVLSRTIPGCSAFEVIGPDTYRMTVTAGVAQAKGTYVIQVRLTKSDPHRSYVLRASGRGAPGTVDVTVVVRLSDVAAVDGFAGATRVDYDGDVVAGGMVGGVGQRVLASAAKNAAGEFFAAVDRALTAEAPRGSQTDTGPHRDEEAGDPAIHGPALRPTDRGVWQLVAAFGAGGAVALAGVALGRFAARRRR